MAKLNIHRKAYLHADGTVSRNAAPGWQELRFEIFDPNDPKDEQGNLVVRDTFTLVREDLEKSSLRDCFLGHGASQKYGDTLASVVKDAAADNEELTVAYIKGALENLHEDLGNGIWVDAKTGAGSGNITDLIRAVSDLIEQAGGTPDPDVIRAAASDPDQAKELMADPGVKARVLDIRAKRAAERAAEAAKTAKAEGKSKSMDFSAFMGGAKK